MRNTITLTESEARAFASSPRFQAHTLRHLRRRALATLKPAMLVAHDKILATCSISGVVDVIGPVLVECEAQELTLYRVDESTYLAHGEHLIQLERGGEVSLRFVTTLPCAVTELRDSEITPSLRALADAAEAILLAGWPVGYYRHQSQVLWSSGRGRIYVWTGTELTHVAASSTRATPLSAEQALVLEDELRAAVEHLQNSPAPRHRAN